MKWYQRKSTLHEEQTKAWVRLINDPYISTYTIDDGVVNKQWVNPKLAKKVMMRDMGKHFALATLAFDELAVAFQKIGEEIKQFGLIYSHSSADRV